VRLNEPLGKRQILDGLLVPPSPPTGTAGLVTPTSPDTTEPRVPAGGTSELGVAVSANSSEPCIEPFAQCTAPVPGARVTVAIDGETTQATLDGWSATFLVPPANVLITTAAEDHWCPTISASSSPEASVGGRVTCTRVDLPHGQLTLNIEGDLATERLFILTLEGPQRRTVEVSATSPGPLPVVLEPGEWSLWTPNCTPERQPLSIAADSAASVTIDCA
jgi:hypothetical protein